MKNKVNPIKTLSTQQIVQLRYRAGLVDMIQVYRQFTAMKVKVQGSLAMKPQQHIFSDIL